MVFQNNVFFSNHSVRVIKALSRDEYQAILTQKLSPKNFLSQKSPTKEISTPNKKYSLFSPSSSLGQGSSWMGNLTPSASGKKKNLKIEHSKWDEVHNKSVEFFDTYSSLLSLGGNTINSNNPSLEGFLPPDTPGEDRNTNEVEKVFFLQSGENNTIKEEGRQLFQEPETDVPEISEKFLIGKFEETQGEKEMERIEENLLPQDEEREPPLESTSSSTFPTLQIFREFYQNILSENSLVNQCLIKEKLGWIIVKYRNFSRDFNSLSTEFIQVPSPPENSYKFSE